MSTTKTPRGYFEKILAIDAETSGLFLDDGDNYDPSTNAKTGEFFQSVAWGIVVADFATLKPIEKLYVEIKPNPKALWYAKAEKIHGLSQQYLTTNGITEEDAAIKIASLILKHWGPTNPVHLLGHNVTTFDIFFLRQLMQKFDIDIKFGSRHIDTNSVSLATFGTFNGDDFFEAAGLDARSDIHNALTDALMALEATRRVRTIFQSVI